MSEPSRSNVEILAKGWMKPLMILLKPVFEYEMHCFTSNTHDSNENIIFKICALRFLIATLFSYSKTGFNVY